MEQKYKLIPTKEQIKELMSDWLGNLRDEGTYVHKNTRGAIDRSVKDGEGISNYVMGDLSNMDEADIMKKAREIAQNTVDAMTHVPVKVSVGGNQSFCNEKQIVVATDYFDNRGISLNEKVEILMGMSVHEASHINYTETEKKTALVETYPAERHELVATIWNILEDERIEYLTGEERPGLSGPIAAAKRYVFNILKQDMKGEPVIDPIARFLNCLISAVRYPASMDQDYVVENYEILNEIRKTLNPFPLTAKDTIEATKRVIEIIRDIVKKDLERQQQEQQQKLQDPKGQSGQSSQESQDGSCDQPQQQEDPSKTMIDKAMKESMDGQEVRRILQAIEKSLKATEGGQNNNNAMCTKRNNESAYINGDSDKDSGNGPGGSGNPTYIKKTNGNRENYERSLRNVKRYIPSMTRALTCKTEERDYELRGEKTGKLDTYRLVALKTGNTNIFTKQGSITCDSACICILIDESGSMSENKVKAARDTAVLINEAVKHISNLELFVYGYTSWQLNIFHERKNSDKFAIGSNTAIGGTPTGDAMRIVGKRIRKMTGNDCLMLVLTDGCSDNKEKVIEQDQRLRKVGIVPVGIGIAGSHSVRREFKDSIVIDDLATLAPQLGKIVKKRLLKSLRSHDSLED